MFHECRGIRHGGKVVAEGDSKVLTLALTMVKCLKLSSFKSERTVPR